MESRERTGERPVAMQEEELLARIRAGEAPLFEQLMRRYNQTVYRAVRSVLLDRDAIDDAMQQTWLEAWRHLDQFAAASRFSTWLVRIAVNQAYAYRRRRTLSLVEDGEEERMPDLDADPESRAGGRELLHLLEAELDRLPELYRVVVILREVEGLSTSEAAAALGVGEEAVRTRLHRARRLLRRTLWDRIGGRLGETLPFGAEHCDRLVATVLRRIAEGHV